jgi:hypothetical protein
MELSLDYIEKVETTITIVLLFILGFVGVILLIEVVLWQVGILLFSNLYQICLIISINIDINIYWYGISIILISELLQIWQVCLVISLDIGINIRRLGLGIGLLLLIPCIKAALDI